MILDKIIKNKKKEIEIAKVKHPLDSFRPFLSLSARNFRRAITTKRGLALIGEIKKESPSGLIVKDFDPLKIARIYKEAGIAVISVVTDEKYFKGSLSYLKQISREIKRIPLLRKDFIIDEYQVYESRYYDADAVLLIAKILTEEQINNFVDIAKILNMDCVVEIHDEADLEKVLKTKAAIIGINNRNLDTLKIDINTTLRLADKIPKGKIVISESGISSRDYVEKIRNKVNAILVGSHFMNSGNVEEEITALVK